MNELLEQVTDIGLLIEVIEDGTGDLRGIIP